MFLKPNGGIMMDVNLGMGIYGYIGVLSVILGIAKEILMIFLIFKGIQVANVYLKNNKKEKEMQNIDVNKEN